MEKLEKINNALLIILLILILFCTLFYIYHGLNVSTAIKKYDNFNNVPDDKAYLLDLMNQARNNVARMIKEDFSLVYPIKQDTGEQYLNSLNAVQSWLNNSFNGDNGILARIQVDIKDASATRLVNKDAILKLLTNIYLVSYINYVNKQNAESYKVFLKYRNPKNNKYYQQYID